MPNQVDEMMTDIHEAQAKLNSGRPVVIPPRRRDKETKRTFDTGATRDTESGKLDYEGFLSPLVLKRYAEYLNGHRTMADGSTRDSDNWQKGIPLNVYMKSGWRHFIDMWMIHRGWNPDVLNFMEDAMCAILFNVGGYLHERLAKKLLTNRAKDSRNNLKDDAKPGDITYHPEYPAG